MNCSQCSGCAFKRGAHANKEPHNRMRGILTALGGFPFFCHSSLGWTPDKTGYDRAVGQDLAILMSRPSLIAAGADPDKLRAQTEETRRGLRVCGGWTRAIRRLEQLGWFANPTLRYIRRHFAKEAAAALAGNMENDYQPNIPKVKEGFKWLLNEAREAKINIGWLLK